MWKALVLEDNRQKKCQETVKQKYSKENVYGVEWQASVALSTVLHNQNSPSLALPEYTANYKLPLLNLADFPQLKGLNASCTTYSAQGRIRKKTEYVTRSKLHKRKDRSGHYWLVDYISINQYKTLKSFIMFWIFSYRRLNGISGICKQVGSQDGGVLEAGAAFSTSHSFPFPCWWIFYIF